MTTKFIALVLLCGLAVFLLGWLLTGQPGPIALGVVIGLALTAAVFALVFFHDRLTRP